MLIYVVRRFLLGLVTLLMVTCLIYGLIRAMPGSPLTLSIMEMDPSKRLRPEDMDALRQYYGLDKPWYAAYASWLGSLMTGDLGHSFYFKRSVTTVIGERIGPTLLLSVSAMLLTYLLSVPMGLIASVRYGRYDERAMSTTLYMLYSLPSFVTALLLQAYFSGEADSWLPLKGMYDSVVYERLSTWERVGHVAKHCILPVLCYTYASWAYYTRFVRSNMAEVMQQDYMRTAKAKGVGPVRLVVRHGFRNTMIPMATLVGLSLPALLSGSVILERIFTWPGMGDLFLNSILNHDYPVIMGLTLVFSVLTLLGTLLADVLYAVVDPRVNLQ
jgi:peptide/nickel transport system permease protein